MGNDGSSTGKRGRSNNVEHSVPSNAKVKIVWNCKDNSIAPYAFIYWYILKHMDSFIVTFTF
jgi:hypothetical protein